MPTVRRCGRRVASSKQQRRDKVWSDARKRHRLTHVQIRMARALGMTPDTLRRLDGHHRQQPWKAPLPAYIEQRYRDRFGRDLPAAPRAGASRAARDQAARGWSDWPGDGGDHGYGDDPVGGDDLEPACAAMSADDLERWFADVARGDEGTRVGHAYVAIEVPLGRPQLAWFEWDDRVEARGDVVRAEILDLPPERGHPSPVLSIDGDVVSWADLGEIVAARVGSGLRLVFVPVVELDVAPVIAVVDPEDA